jgi:hypothetical protein
VVADHLHPPTGTLFLDRRSNAFINYAGMLARNEQTSKTAGLIYYIDTTIRLPLSTNTIFCMDVIFGSDAPYCGSQYR